MHKKICVVTGTRAEYGILRKVMLRLAEGFDVQVIATGTHLVDKFGGTIFEIESDGFEISFKVQNLLAGDDGQSMAKSVGLGMIGLADAFAALQPDALLIVGDRFEILAAASTALLMNIPILHIHGGEKTEGAVDEQIRHAISKMSSLHFVSTRRYSQRLVQMGEHPESVHVSGAPGLDNIQDVELISRSELMVDLDFEFGDTLFLVTYHPVTRANSDIENQLDFLFSALDHFHQANVIWTFPNADAYHGRILEQVESYAARNRDRVYLTPSLGWKRYLSAMDICDVVVGNSSSGIIESPSLHTPAVDIGDRQRGRIRADSIIGAEYSKESVVGAIDMALSTSFIELTNNVSNPYGDGQAAGRINDVIKSTNLKSLVRKEFYDIAEIL